MNENKYVHIQEFDYLLDFNKTYLLDLVMQNVPYKECKTYLKEFDIPKEKYKEMCTDFLQIRSTIRQTIEAKLRA